MSISLNGENNNSIANPPSPVPTPPSIWHTQSDNKLAAPDALNILGNMSFISEFAKGGASGLLGNAMSMMKGGSDMFGKIEQAMGFVGNVQSVLQGNGSILDRIGALSGIAGGALSSLGLSENSSILAGVNGLGNLAMNIGGVVQTIKNTNFKDVNSLLSLAAGITGNTGFMKLAEYATQAQYMIGMIKGFANANIPNSFGLFADMIKGNPNKNQIVSDTYHTLIKKQDLDSINSMVTTLGRDQFNRVINSGSDLATEEAVDIGGNSFKTSGSFLNILSSNWDKTNEGLGKTDEKQFDQVYSTIRTVNGDNWLYVDRAGKYTINAKDFANSTDRFRQLSSTGFTKSNQIKITHDSSLNNEVSSTIAYNAKTKKDDEKFLLGSYRSADTVTNSLKKQFPHLLVDDNTIKL